MTKSKRKNFTKIIRRIILCILTLLLVSGALHICKEAALRYIANLLAATYSDTIDENDYERIIDRTGIPVNDSNATVNIIVKNEWLSEFVYEITLLDEIDIQNTATGYKYQYTNADKEYQHYDDLIMNTVEKKKSLKRDPEEQACIFVWQLTEEEISEYPVVVIGEVYVDSSDCVVVKYNVTDKVLYYYEST